MMAENKALPIGEAWNALDEAADKIEELERERLSICELCKSLHDSPHSFLSQMTVWADRIRAVSKGNAGSSEPTCSEFRLPTVAGRCSSMSNADFERACLVHIERLQHGLGPYDSAMLATFCEAVRMVREYSDAMQVRTPSAQAAGCSHQWTTRPIDGRIGVTAILLSAGASLVAILWLRSIALYVVCIATCISIGQFTRASRRLRPDVGGK
jgi:hypothetical protein